MTTQEFIRRSILRHGDRFDYSKSEYTSSTEKITVICKIHEGFLVAPYSHMGGTGCAKCSGKAKKTTESFVQEMITLNGDKFDYSKVEYKNSKTPIHVICENGHSFWPIPNNHAKGFGCPVCYGHLKQDQTEFVNACINTHCVKHN